MFGVFLFLTYYLQQTLAFSPVQTGVAFLPLVGALILIATTTSAALLPRVGPKPLVTTGMLLSAAGMILLTQVGVDSSRLARDRRGPATARLRWPDQPGSRGGMLLRQRGGRRLQAMQPSKVLHALVMATGTALKAVAYRSSTNMVAV
jgi:hypothetical protein